MHVALTGIDEQVSGDLLEQEGADSCSHSADSCDCGSSLLGKEVSADGIKVGRPALVRCSCEAYADHGEPGGYIPQRLCEQDHKRYEGEDEHSPGPARVRILACPVHEYGRKLASEDGEHRDKVQDKDKGYSQRVGGLDPELCVEIGRSPEKEEPPDSVGYEPCEDEGPGFLVLEDLTKGHLFLLGRALFLLLGELGISLSILLDLGEFGSIDHLVL